MLSRLSVEGNAKTGERSMEGPPDDVNELNYFYSTTEETFLSSKRAHLMCPRTDIWQGRAIYQDKPQYSGLVDGINDVVTSVAFRFSLDILSVSHVVESNPRHYTSITCTVVCAFNEFTKDQIGETLQEENGRPDTNLYCFLDAGKLSIRVEKIRYN